MYSSTITLFNYYENPEAEDAYWYPHVLSNVDLNTDRGAIIKKYGHDAADKAQLHILYGTDQTGQKVIPDKDGNAVPWLPPKEWQKQEGDRLMNSLTFSPESDAVIYCDIPYKNTNRYGDEKAEFDYNSFYDWACSQNVPVFISEYDMPEDRFECVLEIKKQSCMAATKTLSATEKLYIPRKKGKIK